MGEQLIEQKAQEYQEFRRPRGEYTYMDKRNRIIALLGGDAPLIANMAVDVSETLHLPTLSSRDVGSTAELKSRLEDAPPHGYVLDSIPGNVDDLEVVEGWSKEHGMVVHLYSVDGQLDDNQKAVVEEARKRGLDVNNLSGSSLDDKSKDLFRKISPFCFEDPNLAEKYYQFQGVCQKLGIPHMLISGACSYIYWGRRPLKDLDILVSSKEMLDAIGKEIGVGTEHLVSSFADTNYLNFSEGVEAVSDLAVLYKDDESQHRVEFAFDDLMSDAKSVRFMGTSNTLMSPEMLVLFKFALGRFGIDKWNHHKDDYEDARGVMISQSIDLNSLEERARKIGALDRVLLGEKILSLKK